MEAVYKIWPNKAELKTVHTIMLAAIDAAEVAEKAWKMGNLEADERNAFAKKLVKETLEKAGINVTPQIELIIGGIIEAACMVLPHGDHLDSPVPTIRGENT